MSRSLPMPFELTDPARLAGTTPDTRTPGESTRQTLKAHGSGSASQYGR